MTQAKPTINGTLTTSKSLASAEHAAGKKYRAFLSYAHSDCAFAEWLHKHLERFHIPRSLRDTPGRYGPVPERLYPIFRDCDELSTAPDLTEAIRYALDNSAFLIVLCSKYSISSRWVNLEIKSFKDSGHSRQIILVVAPSTDTSSKYYDFFPPALCLPNHAGTGNDEHYSEPLAVDAREHADGKYNCIIKIASSLAGIDYELLKKRHAAYITKTKWVRRMLIGISALAIANISLGVLWSFDTSRAYIFDYTLNVLRIISKFTLNKGIKHSICYTLWADADLKGRQNQHDKVIQYLSSCQDAISNLMDPSSRSVRAENIFKMALALRNSNVNNSIILFTQAIEDLENMNKNNICSDSDRAILVSAYIELARLQERRDNIENSITLLDSASKVASQVLQNNADEVEAWKDKMQAVFTIETLYLSMAIKMEKEADSLMRDAINGLNINKDYIRKSNKYRRILIEYEQNRVLYLKKEAEICNDLFLVRKTSAALLRGAWIDLCDESDFLNKIQSNIVDAEKQIKSAEMFIQAGNNMIDFDLQ